LRRSLKQIIVYKLIRGTLLSHSPPKPSFLQLTHKSGLEIESGLIWVSSSKYLAVSSIIYLFSEFSEFYKVAGGVLVFTKIFMMPLIFSLKTALLYMVGGNTQGLYRQLLPCGVIVVYNVKKCGNMRNSGEIKNERLDMAGQLTDIQLHTLRFIYDYIKSNDCAPTQKEIGEALGISSTAASARIFYILEHDCLRKTDAEKGKCGRNIALTEKGISACEDNE
jgi:DNA-binding MarR family transcriptional regulator